MHRFLLGLLLAASYMPANHAGEVIPRKARHWDPRAPEGWCSVRVWVDEEVNIFVRGGRVLLETVRGQRPYDAGTECTGPVPRGPMDFRFRGIDGRGHVDLIEEPRRHNDYTAWVRIIDRKRGGEEHHFRIYWRLRGR